MKKRPSPAKSSCTSSAREKWRKKRPHGRFFLSRQSRTTFCREAALIFCGQRPHFLPPPRGVLSSPPFSFRAKRERAAGAVPERTRQGHGSLSSCMKHEWAPGPQRARRNAAQRKYTPVGARTARPRLPEIEQKRRRTRLGESPSQRLPCVKGAFTGALSLGPAGVSGGAFYASGGAVAS